MSFIYTCWLYGDSQCEAYHWIEETIKFRTKINWGSNFFRFMNMYQVKTSSIVDGKLKTDLLKN